MAHTWLCFGYTWFHPTWANGKIISMCFPRISIFLPNSAKPFSSSSWISFNLKAQWKKITDGFNNNYYFRIILYFFVLSTKICLPPFKWIISRLSRIYILTAIIKTKSLSSSNRTWFNKLLSGNALDQLSPSLFLCSHATLLLLVT